jgi:hypothetical protein
MSTKKSWFVPAALVLTSFVGMSAASAQDATCQYTLASLQGSYAVIGNYSGGIALALGIESFDGQGNLTRNAIVNQPLTGSTTGERTRTITTSTGTYAVNCDGTGTYSRVITNATTGALSNTTGDFVITGAVVTDGQLIATAFTDAQTNSAVIVPGGVFVYFVHTRLPDVPSAQSSTPTAPKNK